MVGRVKKKGGGSWKVVHIKQVEYPHTIPGGDLIKAFYIARLYINGAGASGHSTYFVTAVTQGLTS